MIRRLKSEVLTELPSKIRQRVTIEIAPGKMKELQAIMQQLKEIKNDVSSASPRPEDEGEGGREEGQGRFESGRLLQEGYRLTGEAKIEGVKEWLQDWWEGSGGGGEEGREGGGGGGGKLLVFAHHKVVLDALEGWAVRLKEGGGKKGGKKGGGGGGGGGGAGAGGRRYVRIDGSTPTLERAVLVQRFQEDPACRLAFLSMTAAGQGITLTAAGHVCFAELS